MKLKIITLAILVAAGSITSVQGTATLTIKNESGQWVYVNVYKEGKLGAKCSPDNLLLENNESKSITCDSYDQIYAWSKIGAPIPYAWSQHYGNSSENRNFTIKNISGSGGTITSP